MKHASSDRCSNGLARSGPRSARSSAGSLPPRSKLAWARRSGTVRPCGTCSKTRPTWGWLRLERRRLGQWGHVCGLNVGGPSSRVMRQAIGTRPLRTGCTSQCRRSWMPPYSLPFTSNSRRTGVVPGSVCAERNTCCRAWCAVPSAATRTTAKAISPSARKHHPRYYAYYRCVGTDAYRFGGVRVCGNHQVRTDLLDVAVWLEARTLLEQPHRLEQE